MAAGSDNKPASSSAATGPASTTYGDGDEGSEDSSDDEAPQGVSLNPIAALQRQYDQVRVC